MSRALARIRVRVFLVVGRNWVRKAVPLATWWLHMTFEPQSKKPLATVYVALGLAFTGLISWLPVWGTLRTKRLELLRLSGRIPMSTHLLRGR